MRALRLTVVASLLAASGSHWAIVQAFAWARMAYLEAYDPCAICMIVEDGASGQGGASHSLSSGAPERRAELFPPSPLPAARLAVVSFPLPDVSASPRDAVSFRAFRPPRTALA